MKFIPILFQTLMVQATLADRKTMTRRLKGLEAINEHPDDWEWKNRKMEKICRLYTDKEANPNPLSVQFVLTNKKTGEELKVKCPYGKEGDILWARETISEYRAFAEDVKQPVSFIYKADQDWCRQYPCFIDGKIVQVNQREPWKPSIHMPKTACRIFLEITNITVERLHDISEADAIAEGVECELGVFPTFYKNYNELTRLHEFEYCEARDSFQSLWQKINGAESWDANPWVWVISFKKIDRPVNFI